LALILGGRSLLAEEPPQEEQIEIEVTESVHEVAEQAAEAAQAIAAEAAAEAQAAAAEIAAEAAEHAQKAAEQAHQAAEQFAEKVSRAAGKAAKDLPFGLDFTPAPYQLGLQVAPVSKALDAQLKLEGKGILVDAVEKDGPGEKAGLKPHDIVIMVAEQDVKAPGDLAKTLKQSDGKELKLEILRGGEKVTIMVQPRNTAQLTGSIRLDRPKVEIDEEIIKLESKIREKLKDAGVDVRMQVIRPGHVMPADVMFKRADLPEGVSISVRKEGGKPAKIEVSRGEEKWELAEGELDKLPEDLRPHVEHMLGRGPIGIGFPPNVKFTAPLPPGFVITAQDPGELKKHVAVVRKHMQEQGTSAEFESIARSLQEIKKDIHRLYNQIDELREDRKKD
jgi:membrane-associated protease RseP (regulator of RpoE activity)